RHLHLRLHRNPQRRGGDTCRSLVSCGSADRSLCDDATGSRVPICLAELLRGGILDCGGVLVRCHAWLSSTSAPPGWPGAADAGAERHGWDVTASVAERTLRRSAVADINRGR